VSRPFTATAAVAARIRELDTTAAELADRAGVPHSTVRYFGLLPHDQHTLELLSVALDWPPGHLRELWETPAAQPQNAPGHAMTGEVKNF
jgi:hypothetical protein